MLKVIIVSLFFSIFFSTDIEDNIKARNTKLTLAISKVSNAVVGIYITKLKKRNSSFIIDPFWGSLVPRTQSYKVESVGSGFLISPDGYIVTNAHVVENAYEITVILSGGKEYNTSIIGIDHPTDIALLKLDGSDFPYAELSDSEKLILGEWVIALGNPLGLFSIGNNPTATVGILSGMNLDFGIKESGRVYQDMIQTDASINQGNSGGPLVNSLGEVIGMNTFIMTGSNYSHGSIGIGFAIPINRVKEICEELKLHGKIDRNFTTGISIQSIDRDIKRYLRLPYNKGVIITDIEKRSSGEASGLLIGDIILEIDSIAISNRSEILNVINKGLKKTGDFVFVTIWRDGKIINNIKLLLKEKE